MDYIETINALAFDIHVDNIKAGWWTDLESGVNLAAEARAGTRLGKAIVCEKIALIHSEVSEALEGYRKNQQDEKLPNRKAIEVELADAIIRILDLTDMLELDIGGAIAAKRKYNATRADHKIENRSAEGGKAF